MFPRDLLLFELYDCWLSYLIINSIPLDLNPYSFKFLI